MIKALVTDFFNEIEKKELKKNKNAQATFWVEELQEVTSIHKNYISVRKATRLYNKYVEERENVIVKEPNKYLLDFMSQYLGCTDFEVYQSKKESKEEIIEEKVIPKNTEEESFLEKYKKPIIGVSILVTFTLLFFINKYNTNNSETCIIWKETHFEKSACTIKNAIDNSIYNINIEKFEKIKVSKEFPFFKNGKPLVWYGKSVSGKMEYFTQRGIHPETLKELDPITEYIINKYIFTEKSDKTIVN
ncbi:hypothetical protein [Polaribacter sp. Hel1_85]|uniref:hypothetical protein n=1 Tax=Polaribacter sp. Hel1_85 TaxID=1250005 RepID=UPI00052CD132|nr:hypothetical protein [Polaribacter sp. Hel1_85]KGL62916.1 hypothetical protein PHEL85_2712 [Polaribacter sp. Hel1_85]